VEKVSNAPVSSDVASVPSDSTASTTHKKLIVRVRRPTTYSASSKTIQTKDLQTMHKDLGSALNTVSGVNIHRTGGLGTYSSLSIRGSSSKQVQIYMDGIPLNTASGGSVDIGKIPLGSIQKITVHKGNAPLELSGMNAGGVVELSSTPEGNDITSVNAEAGTYGYHKVGGLVTRRLQQLAHRFSLDYAHSDNNYPYLYDITPYESGDEIEKRMENQQYTSFDSRYAFSLLLPQLAHRFIVQGSFSQTSNGESDTNPDANAINAYTGYTRERNFSLLQRYKGALGERFSFDVSLLGRYLKSLYRNRTERKEILMSTPYIEFQVMNRYRINKRITVKSLVEVLYEHFSGDDTGNNDKTGPFYNRLLTRAGVETEYQPIDNVVSHLKATLGYQADSTNGESIFLNQISDQPSKTHTTLRGIESDIRTVLPFGLALFASGKYHERSPSFYEKFSYGLKMHGNESLRPETRTEFDIGMALEKKYISTSITGFRSWSKDKIVFIGRASHLLVPMNISGIEGIGLEWELNASTASVLTFTNIMTVMENVIVASAVDDWVGNDEPLLPSFKNWSALTLRFKWFTLSHSALFSSGFYTDPYNIADKLIVPSPEFSVIVSYSFTENCKIAYRLENYLNRRIYESDNIFKSVASVYGDPNPRPGRMHVAMIQLFLE